MFLSNLKVCCHIDRAPLFNLFEFEQNVRNSAIGSIQNIQSGDKTKGDFHFFKKLNGMSKKMLRQVIGIDVAQKELVISLGRMYDDLSPELYSHKVVANTPKGFLTLISWVKKMTDPDVGLRFVMEATGVYHESLAYFLEEKGYTLSIIMPNKISNYMRTLDIKSVTDKTCSDAIAMFGLEKKLTDWKKPKKIYKNLRQLSREREQVVQLRSMAKNHLHAEQAEAYPNPDSVARIKKQIVFLNKQEQEIKTAITSLSNQDGQIKAAVKTACSISGIGTITACAVLGETNGFELIRNKRQLASYAGFDVVEKQSGTSIKGKARISKRGNKHLRKAMHLPALAAIRCDERFKAIFTRLVARHGIKMKAAVAVQRKLLELIYTLFKNNSSYDKGYLQKTREQQKVTP